MTRKLLTLSFIVIAAGATVAAPAAYAGAQSDDFWSQLNCTDGGGNVFAHVPDRPIVPATPAQAANLRYQELQRQVSDGSANVFANLPDRPRIPATAAQAANLRNLEIQRQITDGAPGFLANTSAGNT